MSLVDLQNRLRELEQGSKLEKLLAPPDTGLPWGDFAWMLQFPAMLGVAIHITRMALAAADNDASPPPDDLVWLAVLVLVTLMLRLGHPLLRSAEQRVRLRTRTKGQVVPFAIVQANNQWFEGGEQWQPATVLFCFDPIAAQQPDRLQQAASAIAALKHVDRSTLPRDQADIAWDLYHELGPLRSRPVPKELSNGLDRCVMATAMLPPEPLRAGDSMLALATPGELDPNGVAVLPASVIA